MQFDIKQFFLHHCSAVYVRYCVQQLHRIIYTYSRILGKGVLFLSLLFNFEGVHIRLRFTKSYISHIRLGMYTRFNIVIKMLKMMCNSSRACRCFFRESSRLIIWTRYENSDYFNKGFSMEIVYTLRQHLLYYISFYLFSLVL